MSQDTLYFLWLEIFLVVDFTKEKSVHHQSGSSFPHKAVDGRLCRIKSCHEPLFF